MTLGTFFVAAPLLAAKPGKEERMEIKRETGEMKRDVTPSTRGKPSADDSQARSLAKVRELMEITDDDEWNVIAERVTRVGELRRDLATPASARGPVSVGDKNRRSASGRPEQDALRVAIVEKLPDAEIKSRLARMHDIHRQNEVKLAKAQDDLRAVLTIRQEAVAVMAGLLPP
jgi:hypothetical protein